MSITRSYNKYTNTYYAYDTVYEWSEKAQKKVQRKKCIGKYDPVTGEIIPTGKRGRPVKQVKTVPIEPDKPISVPKTTDWQIDNILSMVKELSSRLNTIENQINNAAADVHDLREQTNALILQISRDM